jgi:hypothetical protein
VSTCRASRQRPAPIAARIVHFAPPAGRPRQHQVGHVGGGDQQHHQHRAEQSPGSDAHVADLAIAQRADNQAQLFAKLRRDRAAFLLEQRLHGSARLLHADSRAQPRECPEKAAVAGMSFVDGFGNQQVEGREVEQLEIVRQHADILVGCPSTDIERPITAGSPPKRLFQKG